MSNKTGKTLKTIGISIIIVLLTIGLSLFMITDAFQPSSANAMALVGKEEISIQKFDRTFKRRLADYNTANNATMTSPEAYERGFAQQVLNGMVTQTALQADSKNLGVGVAKTVVRDRLDDIEFFKDDFTGKFSESKMDSVLASNQIFKDDYLEDLNSELKIQQVVSGTVAAIKAPLQYAEQRYKFLTEQRKVSVLTLSADAVDTPETPDDEVLSRYISENESTFTAPEYRRFTLLRVELTDIGPDIRISEKEVRDQYDYKVEVGQVGTPETRSVTLINATNETLALEAVGELQAGKAVEDVVTQFGFLEPTEYTNVEQDAIIDAAPAASAFTGKAGDVLAVEGKLGWFIVKIGDITPATSPTFEDMREELERDLKKDLATGKLFDVIDAVETGFDEGLTLEDAAARASDSVVLYEEKDADVKPAAGQTPREKRTVKAGASISSIDFISRLGVTQDNLKLDGISFIKGVAEDEEILKQVFTNDVEYETDIFETSTGGYAALRVDEIIDSRVKTLDEVREQATQLWINAQIDDALNTLAADIKTRADAGESLKDIKDNLTSGATLEDLVIVRSARIPSLGGAVTVRAFEAQKGDIVRGDGPTSLTRNIVSLNDIVSNADNLAGGFADAMQTQATEAISSDIQNAYRQALITENEVVTFDEKLRLQLGVSE